MTSQIDPAGHTIGLDMPKSGQMYPTGQMAQSGWPSLGWKKPGVHKVKLREFFGQNVPFGHKLLPKPAQKKPESHGSE